MHTHTHKHSQLAISSSRSLCSCIAERQFARVNSLAINIGSINQGEPDKRFNLGGLRWTWTDPSSQMRGPSPPTPLTMPGRRWEADGVGLREDSSFGNQMNLISKSLPIANASKVCLLFNLPVFPTEIRIWVFLLCGHECFIGKHFKKQSISVYLTGKER